MAFVFGVIAASILDGSILYVFSSISTKTGLAFRKAIVSAVAKKVKGVVIISSSGCISKAIIASKRASVPLEQDIAYFEPVNFSRFLSSSSI